MIMPTKHLAVERSLLAVGGRCLALLSTPKTVSALWNDLRVDQTGWRGSSELTFDWFVLALDLLFAIGAIEYRRGLVTLTTR